MCLSNIVSPLQVKISHSKFLIKDSLILFVGFSKIALMLQNKESVKNQLCFVIYFVIQINKKCLK